MKNSFLVHTILVLAAGHSLSRTEQEYRRFLAELDLIQTSFVKRPQPAKPVAITPEIVSRISSELTASLELTAAHGVLSAQSMMDMMHCSQQYLGHIFRHARGTVERQLEDDIANLNGQMATLEARLKAHRSFEELVNQGPPPIPLYEMRKQQVLSRLDSLVAADDFREVTAIPLERQNYWRGLLMDMTFSPEDGAIPSDTLDSVMSRFATEFSGNLVAVALDISTSYVSKTYTFIALMGVASHIYAQLLPGRLVDTEAALARLQSEVSALHAVREDL